MRLKFCSISIVFCLFQSGVSSAEQVLNLGDMLIEDASMDSKTQKIAKPMTELNGDELRRNIGQTIGESLQNELGIYNQSFGSGVGMPVIRGQSGPRVRVLQNGVGNNDLSQLSPDHASGVDPIIADKVEVLLGPAALLYGNGSLGGVVNVIDKRIPEQTAAKPVGGAFEQRYDSATTESSTALKLEGGKDAFAYHMDGFYRDQDNTHIGGNAIDEVAVRAIDPSFKSVPEGALQNSRGVIPNTSALTRGASLGASWIGERGLLGMSINHLDKKYGVPPDGRGAHEEAPAEELSHEHGDVNVNMQQTKYDLKANLNRPFQWAEQIRAKFAYTDYRHVEVEAGIPGTTFMNSSYESRLELDHSAFHGINGLVGFQSLHSDFIGLGEEGQIVPHSLLQNFGVFVLQNWKQGKFSYKWGGRVEWQGIDPEGRQSVSHVPVSGSVSLNWHPIKAHQFDFAFTHAERAPQIQELFSDGFHHATRSYERGNATLKKESSNNLDLSYHFNHQYFSLDFNLFHNWVANYIYQQRSGTELFSHDTEAVQNTNLDCEDCFTVLDTQQAAAIFKGFEAKVNVPVFMSHWGNLDLDLFSDYTRGEFERGGDVPRMPPLRYGFQLNYEKGSWYSNLRLTRAEAQTHPGDYDSVTPAYLLVNLNSQYRLGKLYGAEVLLFAKGKNLLNENIRNATSYLRNFAPEPGRSAELGIRVEY